MHNFDSKTSRLYCILLLRIVFSHFHKCTFWSVLFGIKSTWDIWYCIQVCVEKIYVLHSYNHWLENDMKHYWPLKLSIILTVIYYPWVLGVGIMYYSSLHKGPILVLTFESYLGLYVHMFLPILALLDTFISSRPWTLVCVW